MAEIKGTDIVLLRGLVSERDKRVEETLLAQLSDEEKHAYLHTMPISWSKLEIQARICQIAAKVLYPEAKNSVFQLHYELAKRTYTGIYRVFLAVPSLQFVAKRAASIWRTYYTSGEAMVENVTDSSLDFVVVNCPELPAELRESANAHLTYLAEKTGKKGITIKRDEKNPKRWVWHVHWKA